MFLKLRIHNDNYTGPMVVNTLHIIAMSPNDLTGTDIDLVDGKNLTVTNDFNTIWEEMKKKGEANA